jgi:hypothetical protein
MSVIPLYASASYARFATDAQITTMCTGADATFIIGLRTLTINLLLVVSIGAGVASVSSPWILSRTKIGID